MLKTLRDLLERLKSLSQEQLSCDLVVYLYELDETSLKRMFLYIDGKPIIAIMEPETQKKDKK